MLNRIKFFVRRGRKQKIGAIIFVLLCIVITGSVVALTLHHQEHTQTGANKKNVHVSIRAALPKKPVATQPSRNASANNPLANRKFYIDNSRSIARLARQYRLEGKIENAVLIDKIASQPGSTWLTGPSANDLTATRDINEVKKDVRGGRHSRQRPCIRTLRHTAPGCLCPLLPGRI